MNDITLPDWGMCETKVDLGKADPIEVFIHNHEPATLDAAKEWREDLKQLILFLSCKNPW